MKTYEQIKCELAKAVFSYEKYSPQTVTDGQSFCGYYVDRNGNYLCETEGELFSTGDHLLILLEALKKECIDFKIEYKDGQYEFSLRRWGYAIPDAIATIRHQDEDLIKAVVYATAKAMGIV